MEKTLQTIIQEIENELDSRTDFIEFKIGKTDDLESRREDYNKEGYPYLWEIGYGSPNDICKAEKILIKYFMYKSPNRKRCMNQQSGGGNPKADKLYLAVKPSKYEYDDLFDDCLDIGSLPILVKE